MKTGHPQVLKPSAVERILLIAQILAVQLITIQAMAAQWVSVAAVLLDIALQDWFVIPPATMAASISAWTLLLFHRPQAYLELI